MLSNPAKINRLRTLKQSKSWLNTEQLTSVLMELRAPSLNISPAIDSAFIWSPRLIGWALTQQRNQPRTCDNVSDNEETDVVWLVSGIVLRAAKPATNCDMSPTIHDHLSLRPHHPFFINLSSHTKDHVYRMVIVEVQQYLTKPNHCIWPIRTHYTFVSTNETVCS